MQKVELFSQSHRPFTPVTPVQIRLGTPSYKRWFTREGSKEGFLILVLCLVLLPSGLVASDKWSTQDKILEATWLGLHLLDWGQTLYIADHPEIYYERNSLFGDHPDRGRVNFLFALGIPLHIGITHLLPTKWRPYFQGVTIVSTGYCVINNFKIGIGFAF